MRSLRRSPLLNDVSFKLHPGEVLGVAALEGQGQEELFDCIAGASSLRRGIIFAHGKELRLRHPADAIRAGVVLVPANRLLALLQQRSVRENIALPAFRGIRNWGPIRMRAERERVQSATARLQIDTRAGSEVSRLSGGNQQKVVIARWLASGFNTLLCFDPTRGIDIGTKRQIYALVRELAAAGSAVLLFTSELPEIGLACDRAIVLFGGRVVAEMPVSEADEATLLRAAHGIAPRLPGGGMTTPADRKSSIVTVLDAVSTTPLAARLRRWLRLNPSLFAMPAVLIVSLAITVAIHPTVLRFRLAIARHGRSAARFRRGGADGGRDLRRNRSFDRVDDGGRQCARSEHDGGREFRGSLALAVVVLLAGARDRRSERPDRRAVACSRCRGDVGSRVHLGRRRAAHHGEAGRRRAAGFPQSRRRNAVLHRGYPTRSSCSWRQSRRSGFRCGARSSGSSSMRSAAIGVAAFRSGVNIDRTRFSAYVFSGLFSAVGGLGLTMTTGIGRPSPASITR